MNAPRPWFACPQPRPTATTRLLCFPHAGGNSSAFHPWARYLPPSIELWLFEPPGRNRRFAEPLEVDVSEVCSKLADILSGVLDKPYLLLGNSLGGLVAFELARALRARSQVGPKHLFVSAHPAPHLPLSEPIIHDLPEPEFLAELKALQGTPQQVFENPEILKLALPILRADFRMVETYQYQPGEPLDCPVTALGGLDDRLVKIEEMDAWRIHTRDTFELLPFPGDHFFLERHRDQVLARVITCA